MLTYLKRFEQYLGNCEGLHGVCNHTRLPPQRQPLPASTTQKQPLAAYEPQPHPDAQAATSRRNAVTSQRPQDQQDPAGRRNTHPAQHPPPPPPPPAVPPPHSPPPPPSLDLNTDTPRGGSRQTPPPPVPADAHYYEPPHPRQPRKPHRQTPDAATTTSPPRKHHLLATRCATSCRTGRTLRPAQPHSSTAAPPGSHRPASATPQHLGHHPTHQGVQPCPGGHPRGGRPRLPPRRLPPRCLTRAPPARHPRRREPSPPGDCVWVPPINWGRHLVGLAEPERVTTKGRTRYREPNMAQPPPNTTPTDTMAREMRMWVDRVPSLSNCRDYLPGDIPSSNDQQTAPSTYMTLMYNRHYTLSISHYHAPTDTWPVHGSDSLLPAYHTPPPRTALAATHTPGRRSLMTSTSGEPGGSSPWTRCAPSVAEIRAFAGRCITLPNGQNGAGRSPQSSGRGMSPRHSAGGGPPDPHGTHPPAPHHHTALPVHDTGSSL